MASPELSAHLRYLNESAHLLATAAPETSRHLMSRHNALLFANQIEVEGTQRKSACGACGALVVPGWEGTLESHIERSKVSKKRKPVERTVQKRAMVYECGICGKKTWETVKAPPAVKRQSLTSVVSQPADHIGVSASPAVATSSTNSSSKKRAKTRKGGLAAILAQKKTADTSGSGFDLMDFMKKA